MLMVWSIGFVDFYGFATGKSIGSGTIINKDGTILTCAHVVVDFHGTKGSSKGKVCVQERDCLSKYVHCLES
jgi:HtrA serine peptidase 2